jgi:hypothetical protein
MGIIKSEKKLKEVINKYNFYRLNQSIDFLTSL